METPTTAQENENCEADIEITYAEILAAAVMNTEVIITVLQEEVEKAKTGLKNLKGKQNAKLKEEGLLPDPSILDFRQEPSTLEVYIDLRVILKQKSTIRIKKMTLPDNTF